MTLVVGDTNFTGYSGTGPSASDGGYVAALPFIAQGSGKITSLNAWLTPGACTQFQMGLYDAVLQRLAVSPVVNVTTPGLASFPVNVTGITGRGYQMLLAPAMPGDYQFGIDSSTPTTAFRVQNGGGAPFQLSGPVPSPYGAPAFYADGDVQAQVLDTSGENRVFLETAEIITLAFKRCRIPGAKISDELLRDARRELYLFLVQLSLGPVPLWAIETNLFGFTNGLQEIQMPFNTVDVMNVNFRQMTALQAGPLTYNAPTPTQITTIGVTWSGPAMPFSVTMDGATPLQVTSPNASAGQTTFYDIPGAIAASTWSVVGSNIGAVSFFNQQYEIPMYGYSRDEWSQLAIRPFPGTPRQYWFEKLVQPVIHLWPVPQLADQQTACLVVFRHRHIQDVGQLSQRIEVPQRWQPAIIDGLAEALGRYPEVDPQVLPSLQGYAAKSLALAKGSERENAPMKIIPNIWGYTR